MSKYQKGNPINGDFITGDGESVVNLPDMLSEGAHVGGAPISETNRLPVATAESNTVSCVIPSGGNVPTAGIDISNGMITHIKNSGWTTAVMTFLVADTLDGAYTTLYDDAGQEVSMPVVSGKTQAAVINAVALAGVKFIKPRSGNDGGVVAQGADRTITFSLKR